MSTIFYKYLYINIGVAGKPTTPTPSKEELGINARV